MEKESVKEYFNKNKSGIAKLFTAKWISLIILVVSVIAMTFIPFVKVDTMSDFVRKSELNIGNTQISQLENLFDAQLDDCKKEAEEMKEYLTKEEYDLLYSDIEHDAFDIEIFADFWSEVDETIKNGLSEDEKSKFEGLTEEQKKSMIDAYLVSTGTYSLYDINFAKKVFAESKDLDSIDDIDSDGSMMEIMVAPMLAMYGGVFFAIEIASIALMVIFAIVQIIKFLKKDDQTYALYFEKTIMKKDENQNAVKNNPTIFFSMTYVIIAMIYTFLVVVGNGSSFGVNWTVAFVVLLFGIMLASCIYPSMLKKKIEDNVTKEKYEMQN